jgi:DNA primase large subunit
MNSNDYTYDEMDWDWVERIDSITNNNSITKQEPKEIDSSHRLLYTPLSNIPKLVFDPEFFNTYYNVLSYATRFSRLEAVGEYAFTKCMGNQLSTVSSKGRRVICVDKTTDPYIKISLYAFSGYLNDIHCYYFVEFEESTLTATMLGGISKEDFDTKSIDDKKNAVVYAKILYKKDLIEDYIEYRPNPSIIQHIAPTSSNLKRTIDGSYKTPTDSSQKTSIDAMVKKLDPKKYPISVQRGPPAGIESVCLTDALEMMRRRMKALQEFSRVKYLHKLVQENASRTQKTKQQKDSDEATYLRTCEDIINTILFEDTRLFLDEYDDKERDIDNNNNTVIHSNESAVMRYDNVSYWLLLTFVFLQTDKYILKKWFIDAESALFSFRMKYQYEGNERNIISLMKQNELIQDTMHVSKKEISEGSSVSNAICGSSKMLEKIAESEEIFFSEYPQCKKPVHWFLVPFQKCLTIFSKRHCVLVNGMCLLSYKHIQEMYAEETYRTLLQSRINDIDQKGYINRNNPDMEQFEELFDCGKRLEKQLLNSLNVASSKTANGNASMNRYGKNSNVGRGLITLSRKDQFGKITDKKVMELPDIEDCVKDGLLPACQFNDYSMMKANHHLKHWERLHHSSFMIDVGYNSEYIMKHFKKYFTGVVNFDKKYTEIVKRSEFRDTQTRYSSGCKKQQSDDYVKTFDQKKITAGCPFRFMKEENLIKLLKEMNINNEDGNRLLSKIINTAKSKGEYTSACKMVFDHQVRKQMEKKNIPEPTKKVQTSFQNPVEYYNKIIQKLNEM